MQVTDQDESDTHTFSIVGTSPFKIVGTAIQTAASGALNHEAQPTYELTVRATDNGGASTDAKYTVYVQDVNERPTLTSGQSRTVAENHPVGTTFGGNLAMTEPDVGQGRVFSITGGDPGGHFSVAATTGRLGVAKPLDFETKTSYTITVRVTDTGTPPLWHEATVAVTVTDANEPPTMLPEQKRTLNENDPEGTPLMNGDSNGIGGPLLFSDPDAGDSVTWSIIEGNEGGALAMDAATGALTVNNANVRPAHLPPPTQMPHSHAPPTPPTVAQL